MRPTAHALAALAGLAAASCHVPLSLVTADGALDDRSTFAPVGTGFAVLDNHKVIRRADGTTEVRQRPEARVIVFLSAVRFDPEADLAAMPADQQQDLVHDVGRNDLFIIENLPASIVQPNSALVSSIPSGPTDQFTFVVQRARVGFTRNLQDAEAPVLGTRQAVTVQPAVVDLAEQGRLDLNPVTLVFQRGADQPDSAPVSKGTVTLHVNVPIVSERIGRSNLDVLRAAVKAP